jgi:hypothetical protein
MHHPAAPTYAGRSKQIDKPRGIVLADKSAQPAAESQISPSGGRTRAAGPRSTAAEVALLRPFRHNDRPSDMHRARIAVKRNTATIRQEQPPSIPGLGMIHELGGTHGQRCRCRELRLPRSGDMGGYSWPSPET